MGKDSDCTGWVDDTKSKPYSLRKPLGPFCWRLGGPRQGKTDGKRKRHYRCHTLYLSRPVTFIEREAPSKAPASICFRAQVAESRAYSCRDVGSMGRLPPYETCVPVCLSCNNPWDPSQCRPGKSPEQSRGLPANRQTHYSAGQQKL